MNEPRLSIVIVSFNTRELTRNCLASLQRHCPMAEVIVVDNASHDGSAEMIRDEFPSARLIELPENRGFAGGNNPGLAVASGDVLLLLNSDTVVEDDSLTRCADWLRENPEYGAVSPRLIGGDDELQQCRWPTPTLIDRVRVALRRPVQTAPSEGDPGWLVGAAFMARQDAFDAVGRFLDESYFMYWEDCDLSARIVAAGWKIGTFEDGHVRHYGGCSGGGSYEGRRPDLYAWYAYGEHRWYATRRGPLSAVGLWFLDAVDVVRKYVRGAVRPARRSIDWAHGRELALVLVRRLIGARPPLPGRKKQEKLAAVVA